MIKCAIIGCGRIAQRHASILTSNKELKMSLVVAVEPNPERRMAFTKNFGVQVFESLDEFFRKISTDIDLVIVCTPSGSHFEISQRVIEAGLNVLIEKPISLRVSHAKVLIELAKKKGVKIFVVKQNRFNDAIRIARESYLKGAFGKPYLGSVRVFWNRNLAYYELDDWRGSWGEDGGALINQAIHHIDILQWFLGDAESVFAYGKNFSNPKAAWDTICASIVFKSGALGSLQVSTATQPRDLEASFLLLGSKGTFEISGKSLNEIRYWEIENNKYETQEITLSKSPPPDIYGYGHKTLLQNVALNLLEGRGDVVEGSEAIKSLVLASGILSSIERGEVVKFESFQESSLLGY